jgi:hypothetical protein
VEEPVEGGGELHALKNRQHRRVSRPHLKHCQPRTSLLLGHGQDGDKQGKMAILAPHLVERRFGTELHMVPGLALEDRLDFNP